MSPTCLISQLWEGRLQSGAKHLVAVELWDAEACICICGWLWEDPISPTCLIRKVGGEEIAIWSNRHGCSEIGMQKHAYGMEWWEVVL